LVLTVPRPACIPLLRTKSAFFLSLFWGNFGVPGPASLPSLYSSSWTSQTLQLQRQAERSVFVIPRGPAHSGFHQPLSGGAATVHHPNLNLHLPINRSLVLSQAARAAPLHEISSDQSLATGYRICGSPNCPIGAVTPALPLLEPNSLSS
jgi:hypothetical protein